VLIFGNTEVNPSRIVASFGETAVPRVNAKELARPFGKPSRFFRRRVGILAHIKSGIQGERARAPSQQHNGQPGDTAPDGARFHKLSTITHTDHPKNAVLIPGIVHRGHRPSALFAFEAPGAGKQPALISFDIGSYPDHGKGGNALRDHFAGGNFYDTRRTSLISSSGFPSTSRKKAIHSS
jgi:hypothetical protein